MKKGLLVFAAALMLTAQASAQIMTGDKIMVKEKVNHDLYIAGSEVTINAPVMGDLVMAGGTLLINDTIAQDLLITGGEITLNGYVGDDIRCAGGNIRIAGDVAGDIIVAGGTLIIQEGVAIGGNLLSAGGKVTLNGQVEGLVQNRSGQFTLNGSAARDLDSRGGTIFINGTVGGNATLAAEEIELGAAAQFGKDVNYWTEDGLLDFGSSLQGAAAHFDPALEMENGRWEFLGFTTLLLAIWYLGTALLMIFLLEYVFSLTFKNAADSVKRASLQSLGLGFLFLIGVPIAIFLLFVSLVGLPIGVLLMIGYVSILLFATSIVAVLTANWINNTYYQAAWNRRRIVFTAFGIFVVLKLATLTPFVGPLVMLLLACMAFGGILLNIRWKKEKKIAFS